MPTKQEYDDFLAAINKESPFKCDFSVGDIVTFTNDYGVSFPGNKVIGFADEMSYGRFVYLDNSSWWFPVSPASLKLEEKPNDK